MPQSFDESIAKETKGAENADGPMEVSSLTDLSRNGPTALLYLPF